MEDAELKSARSILTAVSGRAKLLDQGILVATFAGFNSDGQFLITLGEEVEPVRALSTVGLGEGEVGARIVVAFEKGNAGRPIILGRVRERAEAASVPNFKIDGERVVLHAEREIELRCGDASIVLTRAGKVLIRGNYVLTRSRGANKIKGAFVDIN